MVWTWPEQFTYDFGKPAAAGHVEGDRDAVPSEFLRAGRECDHVGDGNDENSLLREHFGGRSGIARSTA